MSTYIRNCIFSYKCEKKWDQLTPLKQIDVRFCDSCQKEVYFCRTDEKLRESIVLNRCVAVEFENQKTKVTTQLMGSPARNIDPDDIPF